MNGIPELLTSFLFNFLKQTHQNKNMNERKGVPESLRKKVLKRDNFRCRLCGYAFLEVHHIDRNPENNNLDNLVTLCRKCHFEIHARDYLEPKSYREQEISKVKDILLERIESIVKNSIKIDVKVNVEFKGKRKSRIFLELEKDAQKLNLLKQTLGSVVEGKIRRLLEPLERKLENIIAYEIWKNIREMIEIEQFSVAIM